MLSYLKLFIYFSIAFNNFAAMIFINTTDALYANVFIELLAFFASTTIIEILFLYLCIFVLLII